MPKNRVFRHISGIFGRKKIFPENRAPSLFGHYHFASLCQKSEKTNEPIPRKAGNRRTNEQTNERTDEHRLIYRTSEVGPKSCYAQHYAYLLANLSLSMLINVMLMKKECTVPCWLELGFANRFVLQENEKPLIMKQKINKVGFISFHLS